MAAYPIFDNESLKQQSDKILAEMRRLVFEEKNWEICKSSKYGTVSRAQGSFTNKAHCFKAEGYVDLSPATLYDLVHPTEVYRPQWESFIERCEVIQPVDATRLLVHQKMKPQLMGLLSARDVIDVMALEKNNDYVGVCYGSVEEGNEIVPDAKHVRAWSYPSGIYIFKTEQPERSRYTVIFQAQFNLSGILPVSLQEAATPTMVMQYITSLNTTAAKLPYKPLVNAFASIHTP